MNKNNLDQALAALGDALKSQDTDLLSSDPLAIVKKIPQRSLSGDHIDGGKIIRFNSQGISDQATKTKLTITDDAVSIPELKVGVVKDNLKVEGTAELSDVTAKTIKVDTIEAANIIGEIKYEKDISVVFNGSDIHGKGILWTGHGNAKQLVYNSNPDRIFSSESIDIQKGKFLSINNIKVLDEVELGPTVTKSNLREVGKLRGLIVNGSFNVNDYFFYNASSDRLGLGTEEPNAALEVVENLISVLLGSKDANRGMVGTHASYPFDIITDSTSRISIAANGDILLGNRNSLPVFVNVHGTLGVNVSTPDQRAQLHVSGAIKFNDKLHLSGDEPPRSGVYNLGDIVWNSNPQQRHYVGWVCTKAGSPGLWNAFGEIR